jgi:hypothetical protein
MRKSDRPSKKTRIDADRRQKAGIYVRQSTVAQHGDCSRSGDAGGEGLARGGASPRGDSGRRPLAGGFSTDRPGFRSLLAKIVAGDVGVVMCDTRHA